MEGRFHEKECGLLRAFVAGKGSVEVLGSKVNGEHGENRWNHLTFTLPQKPSSAHIPFHEISLPTQMLYLFLKTNTLLLSQGMEYDHEGQKTSTRNLEKENPITCHSVEEGEENKNTKLFFPFLCT